VSGRRYRIEPNDQNIDVVSLAFDEEGAVLTIEKDCCEHRIVGGSGAWLKSVTTLENGISGSIAAAGAWADDETYCLQVYFIETSYRLTFECRVSGDSLTLNSSLNVSFGPTERPHLTGFAE
jgi:hypothetical protein